MSYLETISGRLLWPSMYLTNTTNPTFTLTLLFPSQNLSNQPSAVYFSVLVFCFRECGVEVEQSFEVIRVVCASLTNIGLLNNNLMIVAWLQMRHPC